MFRRALGVAVAAVAAALMCGPAAAQSPAPLTIIDPPDGSTVRAALPLRLAITSPDLALAPGRRLETVVSIDGRIIANWCGAPLTVGPGFDGRRVHHCEVSLARIPAGTAPGRRIDIPITPASPTLPPGTHTPVAGTTNWTAAGEAGPRPRDGIGGFYFGTIEAPFDGVLGHPTGTREVEVTLWEFGGAFDVPTLAARGTSRFTVARPRLSVVYDNTLPTRRILDGVPPHRALTRNRGGVSQGEVGKLSGKLLLVKSDEEIAATIRRAVRGPCVASGFFRGNAAWLAAARLHCRQAGTVFIDEITPDFADWDPATVAERGRPGPGTRLARAMRLLDTRSPWGFTWASRVHMYLSPTVMLDLANQAQSPRSYTQIGPAFARSGGIWMEMYRGSAGYGARAFTEAEWRTAPAGVNALVKKYGGSTGQLHYLITRAPKVQQVKDRYGNLCASPMACQWALGEETSLGRQIMNNGVGAYRVSDQATAWLREYNRRFTD